MTDPLSNYSYPEADWNYGDDEPAVRTVKCNACYGSGLDRHGLGDCIECEGYGDIEITD